MKLTWINTNKLLINPEFLNQAKKYTEKRVVGHDINTSLFEQRSTSTITMADPKQNRHRLLLPTSRVAVRQKKSYLTDRTRPKKNENSTSVKESLSKFLADTELQDDDMMDLFKATTNKSKEKNKDNIGSTSINNITNSGSGDDKNSKNTNISTNDKNDNKEGDENNNDSQEFLFDHKALLKATKKPSSRTKLRSRSRSQRPNGKKDSNSKKDRKKKTVGREKDRRQWVTKKQSTSNSGSNNYKNTSSDSNDEDIDIDAESFAGDDEDEVSISSSESKNNHSTRERSERIGRRSSVSQSKNNDRGSRLRRSRSVSRARNTTPRSSRSLSRAPSTPRSAPSRTQSLKKGKSSNSTTSVRRPPRRTRSDMSCERSSNRGTHKSLSMGLEGLNKQDRRTSIKEQYRSPSVDPGNRRRDHDNDDGGGSVASSMSYRSTRSSYKPSGLEGGALNAFMGNTHIAQTTTSRGRSIVTPTGGNCSVASAPADENYIRERKARQDLIMDVALKEKWRHEAEATKEAERLGKEKFDANYYSSDEDLGTKKKQGLVKKMKKAARKTARASRSGAKGAANVVKDPKRAGKRVGKVAKGVGKETARMVMDPSLAAKRGTQGIVDTVNFTANAATNVAKEGFDVTSSLTKKGIKGAAMVVDGTIDGAGRFVQGATDIMFFNDGQVDSEDEYDDYDPRSLSTSGDRQVCKKTFAERMSTTYDDTEVNRKLGEEFDNNRSRIRSSKIIPALKIKTTPSKANKNNGWYDI